MMQEDMEYGEVGQAASSGVPEQDAPRPWVMNAVRRQNRFFGVTMFIVLVGFAALLGTGTFNIQEAEEVGEYDADAGTVGTEADNAKVQEALDQLQGKKPATASSWIAAHQHKFPTDPFQNAKKGGGGFNLNNGRGNHTMFGNIENLRNRTHDVVGGHGIVGKYGGRNNLTGHMKPAGATHNGPLHNNGLNKTRPEAASQSTSSPLPVSGSSWLSAKVTKASGVMYEIVEQLVHDPAAFTQGLTFFNGRLFESTGLYGQSTVRELDPATGEVIDSTSMQTNLFGEGMAYYNDTLIQITWKAGEGLVYNANDLAKPPETFSYTTTKNNEGWGITYDPDNNELIVSDGSNNLIFWDPETFEHLRTLEVFRIDGSEPATKINELEYWRGRVLANIWYEDVVVVIDPATGAIEKEYDFSKLWPKSDRPRGTDCLNGISISSDPDVLYITGKKWNRLYRVKLLP